MEISEQSSHQFIHTNFVPVDFGKNMSDSIYCIFKARRYPEQRITKWVNAENDRLRK